MLFSTATLFGIYKLCGVRDPKWFFVIAFSMIIIHFGGFFTAPDTPQALAVVLFLFAYRRFLLKPGIAEGALLGLAAAAIGYSKYQGILFVLILALLQIRLIRKPGYWAALIITVGALLPIYLTDPETVQQTLQFHLSERGSMDWSPDLTLNFMVSQLIVMGPLAALVIVFAVVRYKPQEAFEKSLKRVIYIYFAILILLSLRNRVEANWMAPLYSPMIILAVKYFSTRPQTFRWLRWMAVASMFIILPGRLFLAWDFLPAKYSRNMRPEFHGWKKWAQEVHSYTGDEPVMFWNSYSQPSKYWFYTGKPAGAVNNHRYRKTQISRMGFEEKWQGRPVWVVASWDHTKYCDTISSPDGGLTFINRLRCFYTNPGVKITPTLPEQGFAAGDSVLLPILISSPANVTDTLFSPENRNLNVGYTWFKGKKEVLVRHDTTDLLGINISGGYPFNLPLQVPDKPGKYSLVIYLRAEDHIFSNNSGRIGVVVR